jgi:NAD(P)-dependent dehydrogenase (short-subunit alcohol dehydrogenase family)
MTGNGELLLDVESVTVVTGAARGIGAAISDRFARHGSRVIVVDIDGDEAARTAATLPENHSREVIAHALDVTDEDATESAFDEWIGKFGRIDNVVVNAGILYLGSAVETSLSDWQRVIDVNLTGAFITARAAARHMEGPGSVLFTSSLAGLRGFKDNSAYSASKFGVVGLAQVFALELGPKGIRSNAVCPGQIQTEMIERLVVDFAEIRDQDPEEVRRELIQRVPLGRYGTPEEVGDMYVLLASPLCVYVTGQAISVDGGWGAA